MRISTCVRFSGGPIPPATPEEPPNPGKEIVEHLVARLPKAGVTVTGVEDIQYAHELKCDVSGRKYAVLVGFDWVTGKWWEISYAPSLSWVRRLRGQSEVEEMRTLTRALAAAIRELPGLGEARWYESYSVSPSGKYSPSPEM